APIQGFRDTYISSPLSRLALAHERLGEGTRPGVSMQQRACPRHPGRASGAGRDDCWRHLSMGLEEALEGRANLAARWRRRPDGEQTGQPVRCSLEAEELFVVPLDLRHSEQALDERSLPAQDRGPG